jgi:dihydroorotate dehydrogenase
MIYALQIQARAVYSVLKALLFLLPAEAAHHVAFFVLRWSVRVPVLGAALRTWCAPKDSRLTVEALGKTFRSPLGLAAGFDKDAIGYNALGDLGFGFVEVGTVTGEPQPGNPKPRLFRLPRDRAIINRMGFNNRGAHAMSVQLVGSRRTVVGVNIGKTKRVAEQAAIADYEHSARLLAPLADYLVVNVSSPNTPGLRDLQAVERLRPLLTAVRGAIDDASSARRVPLLVKIAPDLSDADVDAIAELALEVGLDGLIATNTTISRSGLSTNAARVEACGAGGLSGAPVRERSFQVLRRLRARCGDRMTLISVGGVETAEDVWQRLEAGATLVQIYTGFIYGGPVLMRTINRGLSRLLDQRGVGSITHLIGSPGVESPGVGSQRAAAQGTGGAESASAKLVASSDR